MKIRSSSVAPPLFLRTKVGDPPYQTRCDSAFLAKIGRFSPSLVRRDNRGENMAMPLWLLPVKGQLWASKNI